jgi:hypothetical protein
VLKNSLACADEADDREGAEGDVTAGTTVEDDVRCFDKIEDIIVLGVHIDDPPTTGKVLGKAGRFAINRRRVGTAFRQRQSGAHQN